MKKGKYILLAFICCIIILIGTISLLFYLFPDHNQPEHPIHYYISINQTKVEYDYLLTIRGISPRQIEPKGLEWWIVDESGIINFRNKFPVSSEEKGISRDGNITVIWFDIDKDGKLSRNDTIKIENPSDDLVGFKFILLHGINGNYFNEISGIKLK